MRVIIPSLILALAGCVPTTAILGDESASGDDSGDLSLPGGADQDNPGDEGVDGDPDGGDPEPDPIILKSGTWKTAAVGIENDPCEWEGVLASYGLDLISLMPTTFELNGEPNLFEIQATDYGAQGFIDCGIAGDGFDCEEQSVLPLELDLGQFGWEYGITYFGTVEDNGRIRGEAVVRYPSVDGGTLYALQQYGYELSECTQTFYLELAYAD